MRTLSSLIADYLETGEYEKQLSPDTIKAYRIDLRQFVDFTEYHLFIRQMCEIVYLNFTTCAQYGKISHIMTERRLRIRNLPYLLYGENAVDGKCNEFFYRSFDGYPHERKRQ